MNAIDGDVNGINIGDDVNFISNENWQESWRMM